GGHGEVGDSVPAAGGGEVHGAVEPVAATVVGHHRHLLLVEVLHTGLARQHGVHEDEPDHVLRLDELFHERQVAGRVAAVVGEDVADGVAVGPACGVLGRGP